MIADSNTRSKNTPVGVVRGETRGELRREFIEFSCVNTINELSKDLLRQRIGTYLKTASGLADALEHLVERDILRNTITLYNLHTIGHCAFTVL
jgi:hypothetical protein